MNRIQLIPFSTILINPISRKGYLLIKNSSSEPVIFKIKTTHPQNYSVKPNIGIVEPKDKVNIQMILSEECSSLKSHRFMVQIHSFVEKPSDIRLFVKNPANKPFIHKKYNVEYEIVHLPKKKEESGIMEIFILLIVFYQFLILVKNILF
ncbi:Vesicle-associated membrane protein-associated protein C16G5.05c [Dictyocoela muelleri]|nr:Vesicle-associated membrane protein-associated protein C16G5.05c [Dictyocoela muelleri]